MILPVPIAIYGDEVRQLVGAHPLPELAALMAESQIAVAVGAAAGILEHRPVRRIGSDDAVGADEYAEIRIALEQRALEPFLLLSSPDRLRRPNRIGVGRTEIAALRE